MDEDERDEFEEWPDDVVRDESRFASKVIPDLFRRALMTGIGTVFMTEEGIRNTLTDLKMPKEAMNYVVSQAERTKRELITTLARELRGFLNSLELEELINRSMQNTTFEIHTTIKVKKNEDGDGPRLKVTTTHESDDDRPAGDDDDDHDDDGEAEASGDNGADEAPKKKSSRSTRSKSTGKKATRKKKSDSDSDDES